jgi:probable rRNA maturation factor
MPITVTTPRGLGRLSAPLRALVTAVVRGEARRIEEIAVVLADDDLLHRINAEWRGHDYATDVISFAYDEHEADATTRPLRGDLLISVDRVFVQAARYRVSPGAELARLVIHGSLHLCGHDHMKVGERARMRAREEAALKRAGAARRAFDAVLSGAAPVPKPTPRRLTAAASPKPRRAATAPKSKPPARRKSKPATPATSRRRRDATRRAR